MPIPQEAAMLTIRDVRQSDYSEWLPLWEAYNSFYGRAGDTALPEQITLSTWFRFMEINEPVNALVAEHEGVLVGLAHYIFHLNTIMREPTCYMQDLFTNENVRGRGVGGLLIKAVYDRAAIAGASNVYWHTHHTNDTAMKLYDGVASNSGFVVYRRKL